MADRRIAAGILGLLLLAAGSTTAQTSGVLQVDDDLFRFLYRQQVAGRLPSAHLSHQPLSAGDANAYLDSLASRETEMSATDRALLARFRRSVDGPGVERLRGRLPSVYRNGHDLFGASSDEWSVSINPILVSSWGRGTYSPTTGGSRPVTIWQNSRGLRFAGAVGPALFFEARLTENSQRVVEGRQSDGSVPRRGFATLSGNEYGWMDATGIVGVRSRLLEARFGRDRYRWGFGLDSPLLSNYAPPFDHLLLKARFWRLEYVSLMAGYASTALRGQSGDSVRRRKYGATHRLAIQLPAGVEVSVFETVIFATDSLRVRERFDLSYANPVIFIRAAERDRGSPDNVLVGAGVSWRPANTGIKVFGEMLLDEFMADAVGEGWWANKWVFNGGIHAADWPVDGITARLEAARLRPFTYSHRDEVNALVHFGDVLGHPAGPNAVDWSLSVDWQASPRLQVAVAGALTRRGRNSGGINYGSDPLLDYAAGREGEYGHSILQGVRQTGLLLEMHGGYELLPGLYAEAALRVDRLDDAEMGERGWITPFAQLRWGTPFPSERW